MAKLAQRYSKATQSSDLTDDQWHTQTDILAAVALSSALGTLLFRVKYANDATTYPTLLEKWLVIVGKKAALRSWPSHIKITVVAEQSLRHWLHDVCETCAGKGYKVMEGAPILSDEPCKGCHGTGKKPLACEKRHQDYVADMVEALEQMTLRAGSAALRKLAQNMDL